MRIKVVSLIVLIVGVIECFHETQNNKTQLHRAEISQFAFEKAQAEPTWPTVIGEISLPGGFKRVPQSPKEMGFGNYLQTIKLKPQGTLVKLYNGQEKYNQQAHYAVIDLPIGTKDLHQCADAVMRLRADYLRHEQRFEALHFNFTNGFSCEYAKWIDGFRVKIEGNKTTWYATTQKGDTDANYWKYLEMVWSYAGTLSLEKELINKSTKAIDAGDVWIKGGSPGHAVLVVDIAENNNGDKIFLLAQSYMPAQEMHILKNPTDSKLSPWYGIPKDQLTTPEWTFDLSQLKTWAP